MHTHTHAHTHMHTHTCMHTSVYIHAVSILFDEVWQRVVPVYCGWLQMIDKLMKMLETLNQWVSETPPIEQPQRFGNKAFKTWWEKIEAVS